MGYESGEALAKDMGVSLSTLEEQHQKHYEAAKNTEKNPDGGAWPAYPSGKCWDEASGKTGSGKKFFHNIIDGSAVKTEPFYVAIITPVIHYCMGGLGVDVDSAVLSTKTGKAIPGLTPPARWQVASMATTVLVATHCLTALSLVVSRQRLLANTASDRRMSSNCTHSRRSSRSLPRSDFAD